MLKAIVLGFALTAPAVALACPKAKTPVTFAKADKDPALCAKKADLIGANCSWTTGNMAQRVIEQGTTWTFTGTLVATDNKLDSRVAAPYAVGPEQTVKLVANQILEDLTAAGTPSGRVTLEGRLLEVDGIKYAVVTKYVAPTS